MANENQVTISMEEYLELKADSDFLSALFAAGVRYWEGFEIAQDMVDE